MTKLIIALIALCSLQQLAAATDSVRTGDKALMFAISKGSLHPQGFMGGIGFEWFLSNSAALRLPLGFGISSKVWKKPANTESDKSELNRNVRFTPGLRIDIGRGRRVVAYAGAQALIDYSGAVVEGTDFKSNKTSSSVLTWGVGAFIGAEWMPWRSFGIALEYQPFLTFSSGSTIFESGGFSQEDKLPSETNFNTNESSILIVLSFYFN